MGEVYKARDTRLDRTVAVKVLSGELNADSERRQRFEREAKTISALNHPHICTLYDVGEQDGTAFLVMEHLEGETLAERLGRGRMALDEVLKVGGQIAEALAAADKRGIVHRDLKPGNVMLTATGVKLLDFGLAKLKDVGGQPALAAEAATAAETASLTGQGAIVGTVSYMAPEQLEEGLADRRTDVWALGATLYEMVAGTRPFQGRSSASVISAIMSAEPPPLDAAPPALSHLIRTCLAKDPDERWQSAAEVRRELDWTGTLGRGGLWRLTRRRRRGAAVAALGASAVLIVLTLLVGFNVGGLRDWLTRRGRPPAAGPTPSIAVLPFADMSPEKNQEYFADGLAEDLRGALNQVRGLRVAGRTSSLRFKGTNEDVRVIGQKLNVATILDGSVRKDGDRVRITANLINAADGFQLWSGTYDRTFGDIFAVQDEIASSVAGALQFTLLSKRGPATSNPRAYTAYLMGRHLLGRSTQESLEKAAAYYEQAIGLDTEYAAAWSGLAATRAYQAGVGYIPTEEGFAEARKAVERALALDPTLAGSYAVLGWIQMAHDWDWVGADRSYRRAMALEPGSSLLEASQLACALGRLGEAAELARQAVERDPLSAQARLTQALGSYYAGRLDEAAAEFNALLDLNPEFMNAHALLGQVYLAHSRPEDAIAEIEKEKERYWRLPGLSVAYHALGREADSEAALTEFLGKYQDVAAYQVAEMYAYRGDADRAFHWLERAFVQRDTGLFLMKQDPLLANLKDDARYAAFLEKMRLPIP